MHIIYRTSGADGSGKARPRNFSKLQCLETLASAVEAAGHEPISFLTLADGPCDEVRLDLALTLGPVRRLPGIGNSPSLRFALDTAADSIDDQILIIEDDYLVYPNTVTALIHAMTVLTDADYFSPYDHPDRYRRVDDWGRRRQRIYWDGQRHWRTCESNTGSFGVRRDALIRDMKIHKLATVTPTPRGRLRWRALTQTPASGSRRLLLGPIPSLATHVEVGQLAPGMTWDEFGLDGDHHAPD